MQSTRTDDDAPTEAEPQSPFDRQTIERLRARGVDGLAKTVKNPEIAGGARIWLVPEPPPLGEGWATLGYLPSASDENEDA